MRVTILDAATLGTDLDLSVFDEFGEVTVRPSTEPEEVASAVRDAEILIVNKIKLNENNLSPAKQLKLICVAATGYDNIDLAYCKKAGIAVCNVPGYSTNSVTQLTLAMVFNLATHIPEYTAFVNDGSYSVSGVANRLTPVYHDLAGKTWGIVGYGNIGRQVAKVAEAIGCRVLICKNHPTGLPNETDIDTICRKSDVISVHTPLTESTKHLIDGRRIAMMKPSVIFVNVARGAVTDEFALAQAVLDGRIGGLGVDVYTVEPFPKEHPFDRLRGLPNVCLTPHMAWGSYESRERCVSVMVSNIRNFLNSKMQNRVDCVSD